MPTQQAVAPEQAKDESTPSSKTEAVKTWVANLNPLFWPLGVLVVVLSFFSDRFLTTSNMIGIARSVAVFVIIGVGQTFVLTSKNIDLSVGSMVAVIMALTGTLVIDFGVSVYGALAFAMVLGAVLGMLNGLVVAYLRVPALLATLGTLVLFRGVVQQYLYGSYHVGFPDDIVYMGQGVIAGIPVPVIIAVAVSVIGWLILTQTTFGRYVIALGGNEEAARLAGIRVLYWKVVVFMFQGLLVGLAAVVLMGRLNSVQPTVGTGLELHIVAGVVLGGTSLFGGRGLVGGTLLGMVLIGVLENGLLVAGAGFFWQQIFLGALIIASVAIQIRRQEKINRR